MTVYLKMVMDLFIFFKKLELTQAPRTKNIIANILSKLAISKDSKLLKVVLIEHLPKPFNG